MDKDKSLIYDADAMRFTEVPRSEADPDRIIETEPDVTGCDSPKKTMEDMHRVDVSGFPSR